MEFQCILTDSVHFTKIISSFDVRPVFYFIYRGIFRKEKIVYEISGYQIVLSKWSLIKIKRKTYNTTL